MSLPIKHNIGLNLEAKSQKPLQFVIARILKLLGRKIIKNHGAIYFFGSQMGTSEGKKYTSQTIYFFGDFFHIHPYA